MGLSLVVIVIILLLMGPSLDVIFVVNIVVPFFMCPSLVVIFIIDVVIPLLMGPLSVIFIVIIITTVDTLYFVFGFDIFAISCAFVFAISTAMALTEYFTFCRR